MTKGGGTMSEDFVTEVATPGGTGPMVWMGLLECHGNAYADRAAEMLGADPDYGHLLAYMIRRFGFPTRPGDPEKDLVGAWLLTTPRDDTFVRVSPRPGPAHASIEAVVPEGAVGDFQRCLGALREAREQRVLDLIEAEGVPHWMARASELLSEGRNHWRVDFRMLQIYARSSAGAELQGLAAARDELYRRHSAGVPVAPLRERRGHWSGWSEDDPKRPYMAALEAAIGDLRRPVFVRDEAISPFGVVDDTLLGDETALEGSAASVYPVGRLTADGTAFGSLLRHAHGLGHGDVSAGIRRINSLVDGSNVEKPLPESGRGGPGR